MTTVRLASRVLHAEWTKLWTVRRWTASLVAVALLSVLFGLLAANGTQDNTNQRSGLIVGPNGLAVLDSFRYVHRPLTGDGSIVARVASQEASQQGAAAGIMVKTGTTPGSSYAAAMITAGHGVQLSSNFSSGTSAGSGAAPIWLRLTRAGSLITASRSADGLTWHLIGTMRLVRPPGTVQVGLFVTSPPKTVVTKTLSAISAGETATTSHATFDHVRVTGTTAGMWVGQTVGRTDVKPPAPGSSTQADGLFTVTGSGAIGTAEAPDDPIQNSLFGLFFGLLVLIPVAVLFMTSEYRRPLILATFGASPRRRRVLAAKACVIGAASFGTGLAAALATYLLTRPLFQARGFQPPAFAYTSLGQPAVLRALLGSALLAGALGVLSMAIAAMVRRGAATVTIVAALFVLPVFIAAPLPLTAARWLMALTPTGGLAIQRTKPPTDTLAEPWSMLSPWLGLAVVCGYATVALALAMWRVERRDA